MSELLKRIGIGVIAGAVIGLLIAVVSRIDGFFLTALLDGYESRSYDSRMKAKVVNVEEASIEDVVIIDIEQNSILPEEEGGLGRFRDWPYAYHGQLVDVVTSGNPKALLFDIIFDPEDTDSFDLISALAAENPSPDGELNTLVEKYLVTNDPLRFIKSTAASDRVYQALVFEPSDSINFLYAMDNEPEGYYPAGHILNLPEEQAQRLPTAERLGNTYVSLLSASAGAGSVHFPQDADGITRRAPTAIYFKGPGHVYPSLTMAAVKDILGIPPDGFEYDFANHLLRLTDTTGTIIREIPIDDHGRMFVNYYGPFKTFYYLPYRYCMDPELLPPAYWENKIAIVGASLPGLMDLQNTPVQESFAGVEIHANLIHSILNKEFIRVTDDKVNFSVIVAISLVLGLLVSLPSRPLYSLPIPFLAAFGWVVFAYNQFLFRLVVWEIVRPLLALGTTYIGIFLYNFLVSEKDKRFLRNTFRTYISPELIDQMYKEKQEPKLGGVAGYHTAFFSDIQNFSAFSEVLEPEKMVSLMNEYLTEMTTILLNRKGTLDKYIGDAIVAFYGSPAPVENHEYQACMTALEMREKLAELRAKWKSEKDWPEIVHCLQHRIGLSSGNLVTGNMGSTLRMNYTMMGDMVNLGARLESSAKQYGVYIQVEENLYNAVKDQFEWRFLDYVRVKGRNKPVKTYELLAEKDKLDASTAEAVYAFHEAQKLYFDQKWRKAIKAFKISEALEDMFPGRNTNPSTVYIHRCRQLKTHPPGKNWNGVWTLTAK